MDLKRFLADQNLQGFPAGLGGCRARGDQFGPCDHDVVVFDGTSQTSIVFLHDGQLVTLHHASTSETRTGLLIHLDSMNVISDDSWELGIHLSKLRERRAMLFQDHAKNCLLDSLFCCEKFKSGLESSDVFAPCWQRCASYLLIDAIHALNQKPPSPSHMLEQARKFEKTATNEKLSDATRTLGMERATPSLLERMLKSTMGFSDVAQDKSHSSVIQSKHDYFVKNSMLSDCYFYLGHVNKTNFLKIKDTLPQRPDLIHILKVAFDLEADPALLSRHVRSVQGICHEIMSSL